MRPGVATRAKPDTAPGRTLSPLRLGVLVTGPARFLAGVPGQRLNQRGGAAGQRGPLSVSLPLAIFLVFYLSLVPLRLSPTSRLPSFDWDSSICPYPCFLASSTSASVFSRSRTVNLAANNSCSVDADAATPYTRGRVAVWSSRSSIEVSKGGFSYGPGTYPYMRPDARRG
ncbi:hypothetical protein CSPX01_10725 [Colletotrichum filicis]|nr:hypothetical protein CSPX01_10725 [Colletotrichum filicis]